jgi:DHA2 family multidrug resistance protein
MTESRRWMIAFTVVLLAIVEVLDITIVAVALLNMKGALSASPNQITWTITVYVVSAAIFMPLTGFLSKKFGRKQLLIASALGFGFASLLCGFAGNLGEIIVFRALQGVFGALLPSLAQSTLVDTFKGKDLNKAMALFGVGIMLGPILGPILGGYITDYMGWRWIFFVNVPVCIIAAYMAYKVLPKSKI